MWTATGALFGFKDLTLSWPPGPLAWPPIILQLLADRAAENTPVTVRPPDLRVPLQLDDEFSVAAFLAGEGMTLTGALPPSPVPAPTGPTPDGVVY